MAARYRSERALYLFIVPAMLVYLFFYIYPMFQGIFYSTTDWNGFAPQKNFIGLRNYSDIFRDSHILTSIKNTFIYVVVVTLLSNLVGLILALLLEERSRVNRFFRTLYFTPAVLSPVVVSFVWKYMYSPNSGVINSLAHLAGLGGLAQDWLGNPHLALPSVMLVPLWQWGGNIMVVFLAGLMNIPQEYYEASRMDGATYLQRFRYVTWPLLRPAVTFNLVISTIGSFKTFDFIFIMTGGGPGYLTEVLTLTVYNYTLYTAKFGYGTAVATLLTLFVVIFCLVELRVLTRRQESYV
jgi:raffinose/stachyose/melibiose transport system permease protein